MSTVILSICIFIILAGTVFLWVNLCAFNDNQHFAKADFIIMIIAAIIIIGVLCKPFVVPFLEMISK